MGHEYVEMRNTAAAVEAYRRALDINPRDYRAWHTSARTPARLAPPPARARPARARKEAGLLRKSNF